LIAAAKSWGHNAAESADFNFLFLGNPGTGKTTVAKLMGRMYVGLGLLPDERVYVKTSKDFTTGFMGQAALKTRSILEECRGGVLFIDEAYNLNPEVYNHDGSMRPERLDITHTLQHSLICRMVFYNLCHCFIHA